MESNETSVKSKSSKETFIFGSWKCRNNRKKRVTTSSEFARNDFDRDKSPYTKRDPSGTPQPHHHVQTTCLPTSSSSYNACSGGTSSSTDEQQPYQHQPQQHVEVKRRAISAYEQQLHEQDFWCPRCNGKMEEPRLLACLHSVCNRCVVEIMSKDYRGLSRLVREGTNDHAFFQTQRQQQDEGCPICDFPLPKYGSAAPPPHYSLQHRLVIYAVRRRLSQRAICCDSCPEEVQAQQHCPTCLCNFCQDCGAEHEVEHSQSSQPHQVRPLWEAKRIRRVAVCLEHPSHQLRYHCLACQRVTCKECMWRQQQDGGHRGHASEDAASAGARAQVQLGNALKRARTLLNSLLMEYKEKRDCCEDDGVNRAQTAFDMARDSLPPPYHHQRSRSTLSRSSSRHSREARERIQEFSRLRRARYLIDAIFIGEDLLANGSDVEILSLKRIILKRLKFLGVPVDHSHTRFNNNGSATSTMQHAGIYHCCTFCSSGGKKDATCACNGTMPGGYKGCGHGHPGHPGVHHWSCCGSIYRDGICLLPRKCTYKITL